MLLSLWLKSVTRVFSMELKQKISINSNSQNDYREKLEKELEEVSSQEMWQAGKVLRKLRPENL
jgi:hypothetical protein